MRKLSRKNCSLDLSTRTVAQGYLDGRKDANSSVHTPRWSTHRNTIGCLSRTLYRLTQSENSPTNNRIVWQTQKSIAHTEDQSRQVTWYAKYKCTNVTMHQLDLWRSWSGDRNWCKEVEALPQKKSRATSSKNTSTQPLQGKKQTKWLGVSILLSSGDAKCVGKTMVILRVCSCPVQPEWGCSIFTWSSSEHSTASSSSENSSYECTENVRPHEAERWNIKRPTCRLFEAFESNSCEESNKHWTLQLWGLRHQTQVLPPNSVMGKTVRAVSDMKRHFRQEFLSKSFSHKYLQLSQTRIKCWLSRGALSWTGARKHDPWSQEFTNFIQQKRRQNVDSVWTHLSWKIPQRIQNRAKGASRANNEDMKNLMVYAQKKTLVPVDSWKRGG